MKKNVVFFVALFISAVAVSCTDQEKDTGDYSSTEQQREVIKAQGHPHELLTRLHAEGKWDYPQATLTGTSTDTIKLDGLNFADISTSAAKDTAVLVVKWRDGKRLAEGDSILAWGFIFDHGADTITSVDMIRAVAAADTSLTALLLNSGVSFVTGDTLNYAIGGFGYNHAAKSHVHLSYDLAGVESSPNISFTFDPNVSFPTDFGQTRAPANPQADIDAALDESYSNGIIEHPFNYNVYGYACYDFDWWSLEDPEESEYRWQSGWYTGYWTFYNKNALTGSFYYGGGGASQRILQNHSVDGWVFASWSANMRGGYVPANF
ncbi:MAG: hypothetical protein LBF62_08260 [Tannerellaceae bacterium]|jgi:hypothetical protein|nr:hypothetical protein [Tannerellaceae bacterium]